MKLLAVMAAVAILAANASGQSRLKGRVVTASDLGLAAAQVTLRDSASGKTFQAITDSTGGFLLAMPEQRFPAAFYIHTDALGFKPLNNEVVRVDDPSILDLVLELEPQAIFVKGVDVIGRVDNKELQDYRVRARSIKTGSSGHVIERAALERSAHSVARVIASVPGFRYVTQRRTETVMSTRGNCVPQFYLDGSPLAVPDVSMIEASTLQGVELYSAGEGPVQYADRKGCGVVLMWSQRGEPGIASKHPWVGLSIVAALFGLVILSK